MKYYVGLDVSLATTAICTVDENGARPMLVARAALRQQCAVLHKMMLEMVRKSATCRRLMTIPGVGAITAVTFLTHHRFKVRRLRLDRMPQRHL